MKAAWLVVLSACLAATPAAAQNRVRLGANVGQQATSTTLSETLTFERYFEQGSLSFERKVPQAVFYDASAAIRLWRGLHAGAALSFFDDSGTGEVTARVPHPLRFNQPRTTSGAISGVERREISQHYHAGWLIPAAGDLDFYVFAGPSLFNVEQVLVTGLSLSLSNEVFPFTDLAFPGVSSERQTDNVTGFNAGVDVTWRFSRYIGAGLLVRYSKGTKSFTPTGGQPVELEVGGLHAGGGVRVGF